MIKGWRQEAVSGGRVLVVGAGTTGNEVIKNLALTGVGEISVLDSDVVEEVNLNRCVLFRAEDIGKSKSETAARRAKEIAPGITTRGWNRDVVYDFGSLEYSSFDCVVLTVDNLEARLWVNRYCRLHGTPLVDTGIGGLVSSVFVATPSGACIECSWTKREYQQLWERHSCSKIGMLPDEPKIPMVITSGAIAGGIAAQECIKILHLKHSGPSARSSVFFWFDGENGAFLTWEVPRKENCPAHVPPPDKSKVLLESLLDDDVLSIKNRLRAALGCSEVEVRHDKQIVYSVVCRGCGGSHTIQPCLLGKFLRSCCPACGALAVVPDKYTEELEDGYSLRSLHIPPNHLIRVLFSKGNTVGEAWIASR
ncbi:MAG: ThiF family adenylyltransferase [Candidatus Eisenbacteria bacterium]|nr:ThiF family adenylyltransferase [Candidatus Eisenbacteria bacterium]